MTDFGVNVTTSELVGGSDIPTNAGVAFFAGISDRGPTTPVLCTSFAKFQSAFGPRVTGNSVLSDAVETFFAEGPQGASCYVQRVTDNTATSATLALNDGQTSAKPTVQVTAATPGLDGNNTFIQVTNDAASTFTGNTTSSSTSVSNVSSFANLAAGVKVTGAGIPAGTYVASVNTGASTLALSQAATATASAVTITPYTFTILVEDSAGDELESHGPYKTTAALYADPDASVGLVTFAQSTGAGNTTNQPVTLAATAMTGGVDANDLTDTSYVNALASFGPELGPGQVAIPGKTSDTVHTGLLLHAANNNRIALLDVADQNTAAAVVSGAATLTTASNASRSIIAAPQCKIPGTTPGTTRTVAASAVVAALRAQVHATGNDNQAPAGIKWPLNFVNGFTVNTSSTGGWTVADCATLVAGGVNGFTVRFGTLCLYGFNTPVPASTEPIYSSAAAAAERMALVADAQQIGEPFAFDTIDGHNILSGALAKDLGALISEHWQAGALFGDSAAEAGSVDISGNTAATAQAGREIATLKVRISPIANAVDISIVAVPVTQTV